MGGGTGGPLSLHPVWSPGLSGGAGFFFGIGRVGVCSAGGSRHRRSPTGRRRQRCHWQGSRSGGGAKGGGPEARRETQPPRMIPFSCRPRKRKGQPGFQSAADRGAIHRCHGAPPGICPRPVTTGGKGWPHTFRPKAGDRNATPTRPLPERCHPSPPSGPTDPPSSVSGLGQGWQCHSIPPNGCFSPESA